MKKLIWLALMVLPGSALAQDTVIYRCTGSSDIPTLQRTPCPAGSRQEVQRVRVPAAPQDNTATPTPATPAATASEEPAHAGQERSIMEARMVEREGGDAILDSAMLPHAGSAASADPNAPPKPPLPPIFQCVDRQGGAYLHEYEAAPGRCELLDVQGLGGATPVNAASCEVVRDTCTAMDQDQRCGSWQQRFRDARGRERFAGAENRDAARSERARLQGVLEASDCPVPP